MAASDSGKLTAGEIVDPEIVSIADSCDLGTHSSSTPSTSVAGVSGGKKPHDKGDHGSVDKSSNSGNLDAKETHVSDKWRFQVRLENGNFNVALKDALVRDLHGCLYSSTSSSFIPSFGGSGLRFGIVWFSPDNEESYNWIVEKLTAINEKAGDYKFIIEPYSVHQNKICVNIPWDAKEGLCIDNVLKRFKFQNPRIPVDCWRPIKLQPTNSGNQLLMCYIDDASLKLLRNQKFRLNYGFHKVQVDILPQKKTVKKSKK